MSLLGIVRHIAVGALIGAGIAAAAYFGLLALVAAADFIFSSISPTVEGHPIGIIWVAASFIFVLLARPWVNGPSSNSVVDLEVVGGLCINFAVAGAVLGFLIFFAKLFGRRQ